MTDQYEPMTPVAVEAKVAWQRARRGALLHPDRPKVSRDGWTVAERDAWVEDQCATEADAYEAAKVARQAANDLVSTIEEQGRFVQSINKSVDTAFRMPGGGR